jgi:imidazolonepropionase-like amidohydrolase
MLRLGCFLLAELLALSLHAQAPDTVRFVFLLASRPTGEMKVWVDPGCGIEACVRHAVFEFNDRGRGPRLTGRTTLGPGGLPTGVRIVGHDYFKNAVEERFTIARSVAEWTNPAERGSAPVESGRPFYVSFNGAPDDLAVLVRALKRAPGSRLPLLPAGEASLETVGTRTVREGGRSASVTQYAITGLGFSPVRVWLDERGELFAVGGSWSMTVRAGWEAAAPALIAAQDSADVAWMRSLAERYARRPGRPVVFRHARLFDADRGVMLPGRTVIVTGNRIAAVGPDDSVTAPAGAEIIDATGKTLLPGLWDMHVHMGDSDGLFHIAAGVTTVRDLANDTDELLERRARFEAGTLIGPRIALAGFMDGPGPFAGPTKVLVSTPDEVRAAVADYAARGFEQIKMYSSIDTALVPVIIAAAHEKGLRVSGHIPVHMTAEQAVRAGFDEIQHANMLFLNFLGDTLDTRTPLRFSEVARLGATLDLSADSVQRFIQLLRERSTVVDPTLGAFEGMFVGRRGEVDPGYVAVADRLPPQVRRGLLAGGLPVPEGMEQRYRDSYDAMLQTVAALHRAGVVIVPGTDAFAGFGLHRELELYVRAGIPALDVLRIATIVPARVTKRDDELGSIAPGKLADLVLVDGNPAERISDIRRTALVMKDGVLFDPAQLHAAVGVLPWAFGRRH